MVLLKVIDNKWMSHIDDMDQLRQGIGLQAYGQRDPLVEYKMSGYEMFDAMTAAIREDTVRILFHIRVEQKVEREPAAKVTGTNRDESLSQAPKRREAQKIYPNDPCPVSYTHLPRREPPSPPGGRPRRTRGRTASCR